MSKPNAYRLGDYIFKLSSDRPLPQYTNYDLQVGFLEKELIKMGAVPVTESKQIEFEESPRDLMDDIDIADPELLAAVLTNLIRNQRKIIDHLQKG